MKLVDWLAERVTDDPRALAWFEETGSDDRIARAFKELLGGYEIDTAKILKTTRLLGADERPGLVEVEEIDFHSLTTSFRSSERWISPMFPGTGFSGSGSFRGSWLPTRDASKSRKTWFAKWRMR